MAKKNTTISDADKKLFRDMMQDVTPLKLDRVAPQSRPAEFVDTPPQAHRATTTEYAVTDYVDWVNTDEQLEFSRGGLQQKAWQQLRKGDMAMQARLDLHGKSAEQAAHALSHFIRAHYNNQMRYLLVIHGRGKSGSAQPPVIKSHVNHWLRGDERVLAFTSAAPKDGGTGALYVVLKRKR